MDLKVTQEVSYTGPDAWSNLENSGKKSRYCSLRERYRKRSGLKEMSNKQVTMSIAQESELSYS